MDDKEFEAFTAFVKWFATHVDDSLQLDIMVVAEIYSTLKTKIHEKTKKNGN